MGIREQPVPDMAAEAAGRVQTVPVNVKDVASAAALRTCGQGGVCKHSQASRTLVPSSAGAVAFTCSPTRYCVLLCAPLVCYCVHLCATVCAGDKGGAQAP